MWKVLLLTVCAIVVYTKAASITNGINKCSVSDLPCIGNLYNELIEKASDNGVPDIDIPPIDPYKIKNVAVLLLGMLKVIITDGSIKAFRNCKASTVSLDMPTHRLVTDFQCENIGIEGDYKIEKAPALSAIIGDIDIHGAGHGSIKLGKIKITTDTAFNVKKSADGEIYIEVNPTDSTYTFEVQDKITVALDNFMIGKQEISSTIVAVLNENSEFVIKTFGNTVLDEALNIYYALLNKFFDKVPAKELTSDDLTPFISC